MNQMLDNPISNVESGQNVTSAVELRLYRVTLYSLRPDARK